MNAHYMSPSRAAQEKSATHLRFISAQAASRCNAPQRVARPMPMIVDCRHGPPLIKEHGHAPDEWRSRSRP
jgi:hypothetical protein